MHIELLETPVSFRLFGISGTVIGNKYAETGLRLMDQMWKVVREARLPHTGTNHWVYFHGERLFVGVEIQETTVAIPPAFEEQNFEIKRCAKHLHVGPYHELPQKWKDLKEELAARGETVTLPSLEVYGHACSDPAKAETTIYLTLK
ncbi:MAG: GyrI-like domain-containing protein [Pirellulales bacterium]